MLFKPKSIPFRGLRRKIQPAPVVKPIESETIIMGFEPDEEEMEVDLIELEEKKKYPGQKLVEKYEREKKLEKKRRKLKKQEKKEKKKVKKKKSKTKLTPLSDKLEENELSNMISNYINKL